MAKMEFTFWWGRSKLADKNWVAAMLQYYLKVEDFNERIKEYVTKLELADILQDYVTHEELNANNEHFDELIEQIQNRIQEVINKHTEDITQISNDLHNFENEVELAMEEINAKLDKNTADISSNKEQIENLKQQQKDLVEQFKQARLWNQKGLWNAQETYKIGDVVGYEPEKALYVSVTEPNVGNTPSKDSLVWFDLSGVQQVQWDDYYTKLQVDALVQNNTALIKALETRVNTNQDNISINTRAISTLDSKVNVLTTQMNNTAKTNASNTYASGTRNIYNTLPEVYTERTLPTKNTELTTKKYVDEKVAGVVTVSGNNTFTGTNTFNNHVNIGSAYRLGFGTNYVQDSGGGDSLKITFANGQIRYLGSNANNDGDYTTKSYVDGKLSSIKYLSYRDISFSNFVRESSSEHSGYYNEVYSFPYPLFDTNYIVNVSLNMKNYNWSIQTGFMHVGNTLYLYLGGNRNFASQISSIRVFIYPK